MIDFFQIVTISYNDLGKLFEDNALIIIIDNNKRKPKWRHK